MRPVTSILSLVVAAFIVGCQDNSITNPTSETPSRSDAVLKSPTAHTIRLDAILNEGGFNAFTEISGQVDYTTAIVQRDPVPPYPQFAVLVTLALDAKLKPFGLEEPVWRVSNSSHDQLVQIDSTMYLEKSYRIEGRNDGTFLHVQFQVSEATVTLAKMWLAPAKYPSAGDGN